MFRTTRSRTALLLESAALCIDCESVSSAASDECPVCGSHSLLNLARVLGGTLLARKSYRLDESENGTLFDLSMTITLQHLPARQVNRILEHITRVLAPRLGQGWSTFHIEVDPIANGRKAA